jgi:hypothetical protein
MLGLGAHLLGVAECSGNALLSEQTGQSLPWWLVCFVFRHIVVVAMQTNKNVACCEAQDCLQPPHKN